MQGGKRSEEGREFFVSVFVGLVGFGLVLMLKIYSSGMTFSGLFSKFLLDD